MKSAKAICSCKPIPSTSNSLLWLYTGEFSGGPTFLLKKRHMENIPGSMPFGSVGQPFDDSRSGWPEILRQAIDGCSSIPAVPETDAWRIPFAAARPSVFAGLDDGRHGR